MSLLLFVVAAAARHVDMKVVGSLKGPSAQSGGALLQIATSHSWTGDVLWISDFKGGVWSVDVTDPAKPSHLGFWFAPRDSSVRSVVVDPAGRYLYMALSGLGGSLVVLDISNPISPFQVGGCERDVGQAVELLLWPKRGKLFVATGSGGVGVYATTDINNNSRAVHSPCYPPYPGTDPRIATIPTKAAIGLATHSNATSSLLYIASHGEGLIAVDFTGSSAQGRIVGTVDGTQQVTAVAVSPGTPRGTAFVTTGTHGLTVVDLPSLEPTASLIFNATPAGGAGTLNVRRVTASADGKTAFISVVGAGGAADTGSVLAVRVSTTTHNNKTGQFSADDNGSVFAVSETQVSAERTAALTVAGSIMLEGVGGTALSADGKYLYAACGTNGLHIVALTNSG
jgi:hypothetical protein